MRRLLALAMLLLLPLAAAQNDTTPTPHETSELPGPQESIEDESGIAYGVAVLVGTLAIGGLLAFVTLRKPHRRR